MEDPVSDIQGISYERQAIEEWLARGNTTSPSTQQPLQVSDLRPNIALRKLIEDWRRQTPGKQTESSNGKSTSTSTSVAPLILNMGEAMDMFGGGGDGY